MRVLAVTNIYPSSASPSSGVFIEQQVGSLAARGLDVDVMFVDRRREGAWSYYRMAPILKEKMAAFEPDLIHVMYGGVMARQITSYRGLPPVLLTFHGSDLLGENLSGLWRRLISRYGVYCSRKAADRAQGVIVVARHLLKALGRGSTRSDIQVIPCGIDLERFKPMDQKSCRGQLGWSANDFHVAFATSAGDPVKRPELARAAVAELQWRCGGVQFHVLSGIRNQEVPIWLNAADVLLLTSKHEGSPTIVKEALACKLPIVSVPVGDIPERMRNFKGCYLAEPDPLELSRKLELIYQRRQRLECQDHLEELSCKTVAAKLEQVYRDVLARSNAVQVQTTRTRQVSHSGAFFPS